MKMQFKWNEFLLTLGFEFETEQLLEKHFKEAEVASFDLAGVVFMNSFGDPPKLPDSVHYKLRFHSVHQNSQARFVRDSYQSTSDWLTEFFFPSFQRPEPREKTQANGGAPGKESNVGLLSTCSYNDLSFSVAFRFGV